MKCYKCRFFKFGGNLCFCDAMNEFISEEMVESDDECSVLEGYYEYMDSDDR